MRKIQGITFDLWDTLIKELPGNSDKVARARIDGIAGVLDSGGHTHAREELEEAYNKLGMFLDFTWAKRRDMPVRDHVLFMLNCVECRLASRLSAEDFAAIEKVYADGILLHPPVLLPKARETLAAVKEREYRIGLISNTGKTPGSTLRGLLESMGVLQYFGVTTFSNEILVRKPAEAAFKVTLESMRLLPRAAVHVGDDPEKDIEAARSIGMHAIQVLTTGARRADEADGYVTDLDQVLEAVERL